jgi:hypothetical protein
MGEGTKPRFAALFHMDGSESEGLGLSVLLYLGALLGAVVLLAAPIYWAIQPQVYENPKFVQSNPLLNGPIVGKRMAGGFPIAMLQPQIIADAETKALLKARAKKTEPAPRPVTRTARRETGTPVAALRDERTRPGIFPFNLF